MRRTSRHEDFRAAPFNVKRFAGRGVAIEGIGDGVNVLCAANEFGKSTSFEVLHALFFSRIRARPAHVRTRGR